MANVAGTATSFNLPNYLGELYNTTPNETPLTSMIGGLNGGKVNDTKEDVWSTTDNAAAAQGGALEGDDPTYEERDRAEVSNVKQIFQYGFSVTYTKQAATANLSTSALNITGTQAVQDELSFQRNMKLQRMARDVEYTYLNGTYAKPTDNVTPRKTRGLTNAITTNDTAAAGASLSKGLVDSCLKDMADNGAVFHNPVIFVNSFQKQQISNIYGYAPESRNVGGLNIMQVETDFAMLGIVYDRHVPTDEVMFLDLAHISPTHLAIPNKGLVFVEPLSQSGSAWKFQLYGEIGLEYGPEQWHGKISGLATS